MASATITAHHPRSSFSAPSSSTVQPSSDHGANNNSPTPMPSQPSQPSSQQSFGGQKMPLSQSSQGGLAASAAAGAYRQSQNHQQHNPHQPQPPMYDPGVYLAVYSGIEVYEMEVNNIHVMRRKKDGWLNGTQILKVAGVDKGKRTKILEKEIQTGEHEKVQGGYGKYQGTWINYNRGVEVCRQYGVEDVLRGLLTYNIGDTFDPNLITPTKEQAMAAQRKRMYNATTQESRQQQPGTFFRNISTTASTALSAINKARSPAGRPGGYSTSSMRAGSNLSRAPSFNRQPSNNGQQQQEDTPMNSQQSYMSHSQDFDGSFSQPSSQQPHGLPEPPRKRQRILTPAGSFGPGSLQYDPSTAAYANEYPGSPTEPNESFVYTQAGVAPPDSQQPGSQLQAAQYEPLPPLPMDLSPEAQRKRSILMSLFMENGGNTPDDTVQYTQTLRPMSPLDLDMPIDNHSHTSLHWAATLSRTSLLRALIACGASPYRLNASGETALMRAALVTNSMEYSTFPDLLDLVGTTIDVVDNKGRTVLHHIAVASAVKGRNAASKYYLESLLEWVVRQGRAPNSAPGSSQPVSSQQKQQQKPRMNLRRFMDEIVNAQDKSGDTALNIAARIGNKSIISQLIEVGADFTIANRAGLRPQDFGVGAENGEDEMNMSTAGGSQPQGTSQPARQSSDDMVASITVLLSETSSNFQTELKTKQRNIDSLTAAIRTVSASVADSRKTLEAELSQLRLQQLARQRMVNYSRANEEEKFRLADLERAHSRIDPSAVEKWKTELGGNAPSPPMPSSVLRSRIKGLRARTEATQRATAALQSRSKDVELKYRKVVSLCTGTPEGDVESVIDSLLRAVESEKGDLELGRVRRFLGGVETVG